MQLEKKFFVVHLPQSYIDKFGLEDVSSTKVSALLEIDLLDFPS